MQVLIGQGLRHLTEKVYLEILKKTVDSDMFNIWIYWRIVLTLYKSITTTFEISDEYEEIERGIEGKHLVSLPSSWRCFSFHQALIQLIVSPRYGEAGCLLVFTVNGNAFIGKDAVPVEIVCEHEKSPLNRGLFL